MLIEADVWLTYIQMTWAYHPEKDFEPIREAWHGCLKAGQTFFDTAEIYGRGESERIIGSLLKETDEKEREKVIIATKCEHDCFCWENHPNRIATSQH